MLYSTEFVFPGHPDKLCDAIADALVEEGPLPPCRKAVAGLQRPVGWQWGTDADRAHPDPTPAGVTIGGIVGAAAGALHGVAALPELWR